MKSNLPLFLYGAAVLIAPWAGANDSVLLARENPGESAVAAVTTSRGVPVAESREAAPAPRPAAPAAAPVTSRGTSGTIVRSTVTGVLQDSSHIIVTDDAAPAHFRYTKDTQFMDEQGRVLSADAVKSGTNATLHYTRTDGDLVLTKVVINSAARPLTGTSARALTEVQYER
jgi:hypothetical protein